MFRVKYHFFWEPQRRGVLVVNARTAHAAYALAYSLLVEQFGTAVVVGAIKAVRT